MTSTPLWNHCSLGKRLSARILVQLAVVLFLSSLLLAQHGNEPTIKVSGCVTGINGSFRLTTYDGEQYLLKGHHSSLFSYNGMLVEITGYLKPTPTPSTQSVPKTLQIVRIKKLADSCP
jgi:hypothetical protein